MKIQSSLKSISLFIILLNSFFCYINTKTSKFEAVDLDGIVVNISRNENKKHLFLFINPLSYNHKSILVFCQILLNKYRSQGLEVVAITGNNKDAAIQLKAKGKFDFSFIFDSDLKIHKKFNINNCCGGTILLDEEGNTVFRFTNIIEIEHLRQLIEKEILGDILYDFGNRSIPSLFSINQEFPNLQLRIVPSGEPFYSEQFPENHLIVTLFSPICPLCSIMKRLDTLKSIKRSIKQNNTEIKIILIFSEPFDGNDVETWNRLVQMPFEKYITEDIFPEDVKYITDDKLRPDPVTIILEKKRRVVFYEGADSDEKWLQNEIMKFIAVEIK